MGGLKHCTECGEEKPLSEFSICNSQRKNPYKNYCKRCDREKSMIRNYGIGYAEYNELFEEQAGECAICGAHQNDLDRPLYIDHDHDTGDVRGLLCMKCNSALGLFQDDASNLQRAVKYLNG